MENSSIFTQKATYFKNEEKIFTNDGSIASDENGITIKADKLKYNKITNTINAFGNVKINNPIKDYIIYTEEATYLRNEEKIFTNGKTKAIIESQYIIDSKNVTFLINKGNFSSKESTIINDQKSNFYYLEEFNFNTIKEQLKGKDVFVITNYGRPQSDQFYFLDTMINLKDNSFISGETTLRADKKTFGNYKQDPRLKGVS